MVHRGLDFSHYILRFSPNLDAADAYKLMEAALEKVQAAKPFLFMILSAII